MKFKNCYSKLSYISLVLIVVLLGNISVSATSPYDKFEYRNAEDSMARIDGFLVALQNNPNSEGYIIVYGGKINKYGEIKAHLEQLPQYVTNIRGFDGKRMVYVQGGFRDKLTLELWIVPEGACPPIPKSDIDLEKVKFKGKFKETSLYMCCD